MSKWIHPEDDEGPSTLILDAEEMQLILQGLSLVSQQRNAFARKAESAEEYIRLSALRAKVDILKRQIQDAELIERER